MQKQLTEQQKLDNLTDVADIIAATDEEIMEEATMKADEIRSMCINSIERRMGVVGGV